MGRASGGSDTSYWIGNDIPDFQGVTSVIVSVENGMVCNQTMMRKIPEGFDEVLIIDKTDGFRFNFIEKIKEGFRITTPDMGAVL